MIELRAHGGSSRTRTAPTATITPGGPHDTVAVEDAIEWLRNRPFYEGQIAEHRRLPAREPAYRDVDLAPGWPTRSRKTGSTAAYRHQVEAIEAVRDGDDAVLATETASGKSLAYTVPAFEAAMDHGDGPSTSAPRTR